MGSTNGLQNNALVVNTIDGLTTIYATAIYDNGTLISTGNYVPYQNAVSTVNLAGQDFINVSNFSTLSAVATKATVGLISTNGISTSNISTNTLSIQSAPAGTANTYIALNTLGQVIGYTPQLLIPSTLSTVQILVSTMTVSSITNSTMVTTTLRGKDAFLSTLTVNDIYISTMTFSTFTQSGSAPLSINGLLTSLTTITAPTFAGNLSGTATDATNCRVDAPIAVMYLTGSINAGTGTAQRLSNSAPLSYNNTYGYLSTPTIRLGNVPAGTIASASYLGINALGSTVIGSVSGGGSDFNALTASTLRVYSTANISTLLFTTAPPIGAITQYLGLNSVNSTVTSTLLLPTKLETTGVTTGSLYYPTFVNGNSATPTQFAYTTDGTSSYPLSYSLTSKAFSAQYMSTSGVYAPAPLSGLVLGVSGDATSYMSLTAGVGTFNGNVQTVGGTVYSNATTALTLNGGYGTINMQVVGTTYLQLFSNYVSLSNGLNTILTNSQTFLQIAGASSATVDTNFNFENLTPYGTLTTASNSLNMICSNATLGSLSATNTNGASAATYGSSQLALKVLAPSGVSGTAGTLTTYATVTTAGLVGVKPFQAFSFTATNAAWAFPTGAKALWIKLVGAGSGASGSGYVARNVGTAGTATTMSGSGISPTLSGAGGLATGSYGGTAPIGTNGNIMNCYGSYGGAGMYAGPVTFNTYMPGGTGGSSPFGGGGGGGDTWYNTAGTPGYQGSGGGGGAGPMNTGQGPGMGGTGGMSGGYLEHYIANPSGTYNITIGAGGTGGTSSGQGYSGGNGGNGFVVVYAYF